MTNDNYQPWIKSLSKGDDLAIKHKNYITHNKLFYTIDKVKSITAERLIKTERFPYEFEFGISLHDVWDSQTHMLTPITQDVLDSIEKQDLESWFDMIDKADLSLEQLRGIKAIVEGVLE